MVRSDAHLLVSGPGPSARVQHGGIGLWSALMSGPGPAPVSWSPAVPRTTGASSSSWRRFNDQDGRGSSLTRWSSCPRLSLLGSKMLSEPETAAGHPPHTLDPIFVLVGEG